MELFKNGQGAIEERRKKPTDDLMSVVANTKKEGGDLTSGTFGWLLPLMVIVRKPRETL